MCFLSFLASGMALFLLLHFALIWQYGRVQIYENSIPVLFLETVLMVMVLGFSTYCTISSLKNRQ
jgi:hypothetical protein